MIFRTMLVFITIISVFFQIILSAAAAAPEAQSFTKAKEFFRGKHITLMTTTPGTSYDTITRIVAPKLKEILGVRSVIIDNRGGGTVTSTNYIYNRAKPDGLTMLNFSLGGRGWSQIMRSPGIAFDVRKFIPVCQIQPPPGAILLTKGSFNLKTVSDLKKLDKLRVGTTGRYSDIQLLTTLLLENFDITGGKFVVGYPGTAEAFLAVQKGELEANAAVTTTLAMQFKKAIVDGTYGAFTIYSRERLEAFPDMPTALELGEWRADLKHWLEIAMNISDLYNTFVLPPGTPQDRVDYLRQTFKNVWADTQVNKKLNNMLHGYALFRAGSEVEQLVKKAFPEQPLSETEVDGLRRLMDKWSK